MTPDDFAAILAATGQADMVNDEHVLSLAPLLLDLWRAADDVAAYWPEPSQSMTTGEHEQVVAFGRLRAALAALEDAT